MRYVNWLGEITKDDISIAGGKGANMGEMIRIGMPVPSGFIVTTAAFERLMQIHDTGDKIKTMLEGINVEDTSMLMSTSRKIKELVIAQEFPNEIRSEIIDYYKKLSHADMNTKPTTNLTESDVEFVAVRSSATAEDLPGISFAGQQSSFLNVKYENNVVEAVKKCWASLYEPRAIFYREKHGFKNPSIAVVVQRMVNSDKSGVMFTVDPISGENVIIIEAIWGLGEYLVLGEVSPDHYVVDRMGKVIKEETGKKPIALVRDHKTGKSIQVKIPDEKSRARVLTDDEISKLARYGKQLEEYYGESQDVEFAIEQSDIRIVQTRPVTTKPKGSKSKMTGVKILKGMGASPGIATGKVKIVKNISEITKIEEGDILVTTMTSPDLVPKMSKSAAIITDLGGATSHAAIVSREMGLPAIVGTGNGTAILKDGQIVTVDAYDGIVYEGIVSINKENKSEPLQIEKTQTKVKVNLVFADKLEVASKTDGVGLLRLEHMVTKSGIHPAKLVREGRSEQYISILTSGIKPIAARFYPKPIWVRTLDARSDEFRNLEGGEEEPREDNPMLGWHGIRRSLDEPGILKAEFEAIKRMRAGGLDNIHVMIPFVITVNEFRKAREIANEIGMGNNFNLGIMVETPACALDIEEFCKEGIDFASFGTNDLTMLTLGVDRNNAKIAKLHSEFHPSVLHMLQHVIDICNKYNIESSICGEAGSNPEMVKLLVKQGIRSVSCNMDAVYKIREAVSLIEKEQHR
ncbi:MAG: phosphoenolpyruvate synthase [Thaumarchaeota archaeon]|nr:phosphoenolpyruvate synthase [Nitrososphaerota archaeon]